MQLWARSLFELSSKTAKAADDAEKMYKKVLDCMLNQRHSSQVLAEVYVPCLFVVSRTDMQCSYEAIGAIHVERKGHAGTALHSCLVCHKSLCVAPIHGRVAIVACW